MGLKLRDLAVRWYHNTFKTYEFWELMCETIEDSPYHRERNVGVHTDMVVSTYLALSPSEWSMEDLMGFLVCVFHDVGKPLSEITKHSEERGEYRAYHGHEQTSARLFENFYMGTDLIEEFGLTYDMMFGISYMIEHHVPWGIKDKSKLRNLFKTIKHVTNDNPTVFFNCLMSDTYGRISDDAEAKNQRAEEWVEQMNFAYGILTQDDSEIEAERLLYLPIAASGSGKSTFSATLTDEVEIYSWDKLRLEWYDGVDYSECWKQSTEDSEFMPKAQQEFIKLVKSGTHIVVDNTNLTKKRRAFFVQEARKRGYRIVALLFPITIDQLTQQQKNRGDKVVSNDVFESQYMKMQLPSIGEVDEIMVVKNGN